MNPQKFTPLSIAILTVSDSRTLETDKSGDFLVQGVMDAGHQIADRQLIPDDKYKIRAQVAVWMAAHDIDVVITTGGTGLTGRDGTPEAIEVLFDKKIEGFGELFRHISFEEIGPSTIQSRAIAGVGNGTYVFCLPGSTGACRTAWEHILCQQLDLRTKPCNFADLIPRLKEV
jgi:molybdenum cofactor biosynthesis protein B